jgi:hypothetical protein
MSSNSPTMEQVAEAIKSAEASSISIPCVILLVTPIGIQAVAAIEAAKATGAIRDRAHCESLAGDSGALGAVLGGTIAGLIAGRTALCACDFVFPEPAPPPPPASSGSHKVERPGPN